MKITRRLFSTAFFLFVFFTISLAQNIYLTQSNESGIYKTGEEVKVKVTFDETGVDLLSVKILKNYIEIKNAKIEILGNSLTLFQEEMNEPCSYIFEVKYENVTASLGWVVAPEQFLPGTKRPKDFNKFWKKEKKKLHSLPMEVIQTQLNNFENGFLCFDVEINCTSPKPARGYFVKPEFAKPKSLPIVLYVRAAGVSGSWCQSQPKEALNFAKMGNGALCFDLNAHGMLNGKPQEYYDNLEKGELKNYFFQGLENRDEVYFKGMYLRLMRTLDFLAKQPEWDGKRILVIGESQGGGQALVAAGLDKRVSAVVATVPAMCDFGAFLKGGKGGWPNPFNTKNNKEKMLKSLPYFDAAHILKNAKATIVSEIGFVDYTCPSNSIYAAVNQAKGEKIILGVPYRGHHLNQKSFQKTWEETIYKPKMNFIETFLK